MIFWLIAIALIAIACAALFYAARSRMVNASASETVNVDEDFRRVLNEIERDLAAGKIGEAEALAAKGELAREVLRAKSDPLGKTSGDLNQVQVLVGLALVAVLTFGTYLFLGSPNIPSAPLASRADVAASGMDLASAIERIEAELSANPDDERGWRVIAPAYVELGRYDDAVNAYRRVLALAGPSAQVQTDLAEALLLASNGESSPEALDLLRAVAASDPEHVLSRLYLGAELTGSGDYEGAARYWQEAIDLASGDEPWLAAARQGLAVAQNDGVDPGAAQQSEMIAQMVSGLSERLFSEGGTVEEWTRLIRSYIVLADLPKAQDAYDRAVAAYPAAFDRGEMDSMALGAGLKLNGTTP